MGRSLKSYLADLASDPGKMEEYIRNPAAAAKKAGLSRADRDVLISTDANRFYTALSDAPAGQAPLDAEVSGDSSRAPVRPPPTVHPPVIKEPPAIIRPAPTTTVRPPIVKVPIVKPPSNVAREAWRKEEK